MDEIDLKIAKRLLGGSRGIPDFILERGPEIQAKIAKAKKAKEKERKRRAAKIKKYR